jgi:hypothetical protein
MAKARINKKKLNEEILNARATKKLVLDAVNEEVVKNKNLLIQEFESHPVTQELRGGETANNSSGTLGGYGNLFSFIGFNKGFDPISPIANLVNRISVAKSIRFSGNSFDVKILIPSRGDLENSSKMPWESGRSWLFDIEKGISGLGAYLYRQYAKSRSGFGLQSEVNYRNTTFKRVRYFSSMYNKFLNRIGANAK